MKLAIALVVVLALVIVLAVSFLGSPSGPDDPTPAPARVPPVEPAPLAGPPPSGPPSGGSADAAGGPGSGNPAPGAVGRTEAPVRVGHAGSAEPVRVVTPASLIASLDGGPEAALALLADSALLAALFGPLPPPRPADDSMIQEVQGETYGPGHHVRGETDPLADVHVIRGAGMDATYLDLDAALVAAPATLRLTLLDLTVDARKSGLLRAGADGPVLLRLERCRLIGTKGVPVVHAEHALVLANDSRVETGYGADVGGRLFADAGSVLARFDRCDVMGPIDGLFGAAALFVDVRFRRLDASFTAAFEKPPSGVRFQRCEIVPMEDAEAETVRAHLLRDVAIASGTAHTLLPLWYGHRERRRMPLASIVEPADRFARLLELGPAELTVTVPVKQPIEKGLERLRVRVAAGVHKWPSVPRGIRNFTGDLAIEGAGVDRTLIDTRMSLSKIRARSLVLRDLTLHAEKLAIDVRAMGDLAVVRLERCRVVGFGTGRFLQARQPLLFHASDCTFDVGFGGAVRAPTFLDAARHVFAVLERTTVDLAGGALFDKTIGEGALLFGKCRLFRIADKNRTVLESPGSWVRLDASPVTYQDPTVENPAPRPLSDLNPAWGKFR